MGRKKKLDKQLEELILRKIDQMSSQEAIKFGLWIGTSVTIYPILKATDEFNTKLIEITKKLEAFTPWSGSFLTQGAIIIRNLIIGKVNPQNKAVETSDMALIILSVLIAYYVVYHPIVLAQLGKNIIGLGKILIGL